MPDRCCDIDIDITMCVTFDELLAEAKKVRVSKDFPKILATSSFDMHYYIVWLSVWPCLGCETHVNSKIFHSTGSFTPKSRREFHIGTHGVWHGN